MCHCNVCCTTLTNTFQNEKSFWSQAFHFHFLSWKAGYFIILKCLLKTEKFFEADLEMFPAQANQNFPNNIVEILLL